MLSLFHQNASRANGIAADANGSIHSYTNKLIAAPGDCQRINLAKAASVQPKWTAQNPPLEDESARAGGMPERLLLTLAYRGAFHDDGATNDVLVEFLTVFLTASRCQTVMLGGASSTVITRESVPVRTGLPRHQTDIGFSGTVVC